jgi:hypothetical protein
MNSWSRKDYYYDDDCEPCKKRKDDYDDHKKEKKDCPTVLKCSPTNGGSFTVPAIPPATPLELSRVSVDIPKRCDACVKIEYASTVTFTLIAALSTTSSFSFTVSIYKNCFNSGRTLVGSYTYAKSTTALAAVGTNFGATEPFSFFVCDCNSCSSGCCYYTAEITAATLTPGVGGTVTASVNSPALAALVVSSEHHEC